MKIKEPFIRNPYNYDLNAASDESGLRCEDATRTQQHFKDETDINNILRQFNITGQLPTKTMSPRYGDFTGISDYHSALNQVIAAEDEFMSLPAQLRGRFNNDPQELIEFLNNSENKDEAQRLGLVTKSEASAPMESTSEKAGDEPAAQ
ncbi:MAG: internal scaffolding protein [Arizlama microvirus]|nr:MAG: internal scaffolding protein [Arizlama microvirus]